MGNKGTLNQLIADFLDIKGEVDYHNWKGFESCYWINGSPFQVEELKFHRDWVWLMQAVEKIEESGSTVIINGNSCEIFFNKSRFINEMTYQEGVSKLEATYKAVIQFIKWYNQREATR